MQIKAKDHKLYLYGIIWEWDDSYFDRLFSELESKYNEIEVHLHTKGGSVFAGNFIQSRLKLSKAKIIMHIDGTAFSMGSIIMTAANIRKIVSNGFVMIHAPQGTTRGTAQDHTNNAQLLTDMETNFIDSLVSITGKKKKEVAKWMTGDNYFNAKKALELGLVDEIIDPVVDVKVDAAAEDSKELYESFAALEKEVKNLGENTKDKHKMKQKLIEKFGLVGVNAQSSDTAILDAVQQKIEAAESALQAKTKEFNALKEKEQSDKEKAVNTTIEAFKGKLSDVQKETLKMVGLKAGLDAMNEMLKGFGGKASLKDLINDSKSDVQAKDGWDWDKYQKEDPRGLEKLKENEPEVYVALGKAKYGENFSL